MPKQHRWTIKRNMQQAANNIDHAISNLAIAGHDFEGVHHEHFAAFCMIASNLSRIKYSITQLEELI